MLGTVGRYRPYSTVLYCTVRRGGKGGLDHEFGGSDSDWYMHVPLYWGSLLGEKKGMVDGTLREKRGEQKGDNRRGNKNLDDLLYLKRELIDSFGTWSRQLAICRFFANPIYSRYCTVSQSTVYFSRLNYNCNWLGTPVTLCLQLILYYTWNGSGIPSRSLGTGYYCITPWMLVLLVLCDDSIIRILPGFTRCYLVGIKK